MARNQVLNIVIRARDLAKGTLQKVGTQLRDVGRNADTTKGSFNRLDKESEALKTRLKTLEQQSRLLTAFKSQSEAVQKAGRAYREAKLKVEQLAREQSEASKPTKKLQKELASARKTVSSLSTQFQDQKKKLTGLRGELQKNGLSNRELNQQQKRLQTELKATTTSLDRLQRKASRSRSIFSRMGFSRMALNAGVAEKGIARLDNRIRNLLLTAGGFYALKRAMQGVLGVGDKYERLAI
ncbi:hypothetical protein, partial [Sansalvadorimonas verongulae]|uniref:hypothetical protein n=1 Tax=Sansalvadorimonas verongulae TaxID=2172824 RepID=UPI0012BBEB7E